jgi:hypothetical protein
LRTLSLPLGVRAQAVAVNSRTQKVYVATTSANTSNGGRVPVRWVESGFHGDAHQQHV